ncbi:thiamine pyrophosphate-dependent dehydrogenase E1 component subunit alpha [Arenibaculum pallidiluteum]|uniref:thiamine pyrophosphate-dependent dehydrogenase E1 component subunit alpha n=1 Tax=Arenibaculum pallidiluteum TaxID=2812559 RepID=UPI001A974C0B|nr:thiamine pyrophosphate-dependent dehydrogenase E1 component subunit alpha [Arenibaculum pallidiluteum]
MPAPTDRLPFELYRTMCRIRAFEERVGELFVRQETAGSMLHLSIGEEGAAAGIGSAMRAGDSFTTHHRGHGIFLARGGQPDRMMAEIAGKRTGYCRGKGGSMHIADMGLGHLGANAIVGGGIPAVVGAGLSYRRLKKDAVSVAFFGDGAMQQGILYESMNMAALWRLPVLFVCINNQYGMGTRIDRASANLAWDLRARSFGLEAENADGVDVMEVRGAAERLLAAAREGRPGFLAVSCYRFYGHARMDKSPYRTPEEEEEGRARDPIARLRADLLAGDAREAELDTIVEAAGREMDAAVDFAVAAPRPEPGELFEDVYGPDQPAPLPVRRRIETILGGGVAR